MTVTIHYPCTGRPPWWSMHQARSRNLQALFRGQLRHHPHSSLPMKYGGQVTWRRCSNRLNCSCPVPDQLTPKNLSDHGLGWFKVRKPSTLLCKFPQLLPWHTKCSAKTSKTAVMERNHVDSWCGPYFPRSSCASQCFPCRCAWLLAADWQCQQAFSGTQNHGKSMACTCLRKHLHGSRHAVHCANSVSLPAGSSAGSTGHGSSDILGDVFSGTATMTVLTSVGIFGASFSCPSRLTVLNSSTLPLSAAPPAELPARTCDCVTLLRGGLPLPVTRFISGDLHLALPESPLARLGALALEPSLSPLLPPAVSLTLQPTVTPDCNDRNGDFLLSRRTGDLLLGERSLLGDSLCVLSQRLLSSRDLPSAPWCPLRHERLCWSGTLILLWPLYSWGPLLSTHPERLRSSRPLALWWPLSPSALLSSQRPLRRERLRSTTAPCRPW